MKARARADKRRTDNILRGAESRLVRLGKKRGGRDVKQAYREAASMIHSLIRD